MVHFASMWNKYRTRLAASLGETAVEAWRSRAIEDASGAVGYDPSRVVEAAVAVTSLARQLLPA